METTRTCPMCRKRCGSDEFVGQICARCEKLAGDADVEVRLHITNGLPT
jgi:hypothetical protein